MRARVQCFSDLPFGVLMCAGAPHQIQFANVDPQTRAPTTMQFACSPWWMNEFIRPGIRYLPSHLPMHWCFRRLHSYQHSCIFGVIRTSSKCTHPNPSTLMQHTYSFSIASLILESEQLFVRIILMQSVQMMHDDRATILSACLSAAAVAGCIQK